MNTAFQAEIEQANVEIRKVLPNKFAAVLTAIFLLPIEENWTPQDVEDNAVNHVEKLMQHERHIA